MSFLTEQRKAAMAAGREAFLERERGRSRQEWVAFLAWVKEDRRLNDQLRAARASGAQAKIESAGRAARAHLRNLVVPRGSRPEDL